MREIKMHSFFETRCSYVWLSVCAS